MFVHTQIGASAPSTHLLCPSCAVHPDLSLSIDNNSWDLSADLVTHHLPMMEILHHLGKQLPIRWEQTNILRLFTVEFLGAPLLGGKQIFLSSLLRSRVPSECYTFFLQDMRALYQGAPSLLQQALLLPSTLFSFARSLQIQCQ